MVNFGWKLRGKTALQGVLYLTLIGNLFQNKCPHTLVKKIPNLKKKFLAFYKSYCVDKIKNCKNQYANSKMHL